MTFGTEAVVRFINEGNDKPTVTHLHGSISESKLQFKFRGLTKSEPQHIRRGTVGQKTQFPLDSTRTTITRMLNVLERSGIMTMLLTILPKTPILAKQVSTSSQTMMKRTRVYRRVNTTSRWHCPQSSTEQMDSSSHPPRSRGSVSLEILSMCKIFGNYHKLLLTASQKWAAVAIPQCRAPEIQVPSIRCVHKSRIPPVFCHRPRNPRRRYLAPHSVLRRRFGQRQNFQASPDARSLDIHGREMGDRRGFCAVCWKANLLEELL